MQTDVTFESREHLSFDVAGMHCAGCANRLKRLLGEYNAADVKLHKMLLHVSRLDRRLAESVRLRRLH